jgi:predicted transposase YbfD/YdcC
MLYTPKKTIHYLVEHKQHYVAQVKANQPTLYEDIKAQPQQNSISYFAENDNSHGRQVSRTTHVYPVTNLSLKGQWKNLQTYIVVKRERAQYGKLKQETACFISDLNLDAKTFHQVIKDHWGIENRLHWVKDVIHKEDKNKIHCGSGPIVASVFSTIAINIHRKNNHDSITHGQILFRANVKELFNIIRT